MRSTLLGRPSEKRAPPPPGASNLGGSHGVRNLAHDIEKLRSLALGGDARALEALLELVRVAECAETKRTGKLHNGPHYPSERNQLLAELDEVFARLWRWELDNRLVILDQPIPDPSKSLTEAHNIYRAALSIAIKLTRNVRPMIAPTYSQGDPIDMRRALVELLHLVDPVMPWRSKSIGSGWPEPATIWTNDLVQWLGMLDEGATPEIFKPHTQKTAGNRKSDWTAKRYRALMAMWCLHLRQCALAQDAGLGKVAIGSAALDVIIAFNRSPRSAENITNDVKALIEAHREDKPIFGLTKYDVRMVVMLAMEVTAEGTAERETLSKSFWRIAFGPDDPKGAPSTLTETGKRYRDFKLDLK